MTIPVFITLGSNINPEHNLPWAAGLLHDQVSVAQVSQVYESIPLGPDGESLDQNAFLNAALLVHVAPDGAPDVFKFRVLRAIEASMGRQRTGDKYAPRPIDLDIAIYGDLINEALNIPDPEIYTRAHVALPLADVDPSFLHPISGQLLAEIASQFEHTSGINLSSIRLDRFISNQ